MSFSEAARAINTRFNTSYSRSAALGRAKRMGLKGVSRPELPLAAVPSTSERVRESRPTEVASTFCWPLPVFVRTEERKLRCVAIEPRHLSFSELEHGDCRYPYGGDEDGEAIAFCGHPRRPGSSYCTPHFHLTRRPITSAERALSIILLRAVEAA
jgi:GcrA cell cycle regulator